MLMDYSFQCKLTFTKTQNVSWGFCISKGGKNLLDLKHCFSELPTELNNTIIIDCFIHCNIE